MISYYDGQITDILPGNITKKPEATPCSKPAAFFTDTAGAYIFIQVWTSSRRKL